MNGVEPILFDLPSFGAHVSPFGGTERRQHLCCIAEHSSRPLLFVGPDLVPDRYALLCFTLLPKYQCVFVIPKVER